MAMQTHAKPTAVSSSQNLICHKCNPVGLPQTNSMRTNIDRQILDPECHENGRRRRNRQGYLRLKV
jgi:hypothetical protein